MVRIVLDTNVLIDIQNDNIDEGTLPDDSVFYIPSLVISELLVGVHMQQDEEVRDEMMVFVESISDYFNVLPFDEKVAKIHSMICAEINLEKKSLSAIARESWKNKNAHDLIIAATALAHEMPILTSDRSVFKDIRNLKVMDAYEIKKVKPRSPKPDVPTVN